MFYAANAKGNSNDVVTCAWSSAQNNLAVMALVYSGADASAPLDATATGFIKGGTSLQTSPFSTTSANEVMVAGMMSGSSCAPAPAPGSGYTMELSAVPSGCVGPLAAAEDKVVSTQQTSAAASMTFSSGTWADMIAATFKAASSGGGSPAASLSPTSLSFTSQTVGTTSPAQAVTLSNSGAATLSINGIAIAGTNNADFAQTNNCGSSVAAGGSCTINVTFTPTATGTRSATLTVTDNASGSPQTASLTGTGLAASAALSPTSLTFPSTTVGMASAAQAVTLSNSGSTGLTISSIAISGDFAQTNNCGSTLAAGANCAINVTFTPTTTGTRTGMLTVTDNASNSPQTASLAGTGTSSSGGGVVSFVTKAYGAYHSSSVTQSKVAASAFAAPAGDLIVAYCGNTSITASTPTISDTAGNVFRQAGATAAGSGGDSLSMFYAANAKGNSNDVVTCTWSSAQNNLAVMALVYSGANTSAPLDTTATGFVKGGTSLQTSPFSTTSASEVIVAGMISGSSCAPAPAPGNGYTLEISAVPSGCVGPVAAAEDKVVSTLQTNATASMTFPSATYADMIVATFKAGP
ncbi:MAG: hypothetical protein DMG25_14260 [Acidobacteria bacterium]|nr:MAG: hypothetical protein DMG25_14260 [Acidobacteriota bacterium]